LNWEYIAVVSLAVAVLQVRNTVCEDVSDWEGMA